MVQFRKNKRFMGIHKVILSMIVAALMIEQLAAGTIVDLDVRRLSTNEPRKSSLPNQGIPSWLGPELLTPFSFWHIIFFWHKTYSRSKP